MKDITIESNLQSLTPLSSQKKKKPEGAGNSFSSMLQNSIKEVNQLQNEADSSIEQLIVGRSRNLHETMIALEKADISFRLMMEVRNKIIDAYHEIMRMQV
jgi:flagellar hook-basal body complex protein FliE